MSVSTVDAVTSTDQLTVRTLDAVDIRLDIAGLGSRAYAFLIDWHIRIAAALAWFLFTNLLADGLGLMGFDFDQLWSTRVLLVVWPALLIYGLYHLILETALRGYTPGKRIVGIRIVAADGGPASTAALLIRNLFRLLDSLPAMYGLGITSMLLTRRQVRIGDLAAGTLLVHTDRVDRDPVTMLSVNESLPQPQAELASELLSRWPELESEIRCELAQQLLRSSADPMIRRQADSGSDAVLQAALQRLLRPVST